MTKITLTPGTFYRCTNGTIVQYLGNGNALTKNLATNKKIRLARKRVAVRLVDPRWAEGCAEVLGCTVEVLPNNAVHFLGQLEDLQKVRQVIESTHGFYPTATLSYSVDGVPQPGYPRIEIHPSCVSPE